MNSDKKVHLKRKKYLYKVFKKNNYSDLALWSIFGSPEVQSNLESWDRKFTIDQVKEFLKVLQRHMSQRDFKREEILESFKIFQKITLKYLDYKIKPSIDLFGSEISLLMKFKFLN